MISKTCSLPEPVALDQLNWLPMRRADRNWKVEERLAPADDLSQCLQKVDECFKKEGFLSYFGPWQGRIPQALQRRWHSHASTSVPYHEYISAFRTSDYSESAFIPDDKCKKFAWIMDRCTYLTLLSSFVFAAATWSTTMLSVAEANSWVAGMLCRVLGKKLAKKLGVEPGSFVLPYSYGTLKSKCWTDTGMKFCRKRGHSCIRKIVSYFGWKKRNLWRSMHRAWDSILKHFGESCDTWSLSDASQRLRCMSSLPTVCPQGNNFCSRCFRAMADLEGCTGDAGQFFEMVQANTAVAEAEELLKLFTTSGCNVVTVKHPSRKRQAWFGSKGNKFSQKTAVWSVQELFRAFLGAMLVCLTSVGDRVFCLQCLPIGGLLSKTGACIVLGGQERRWKQSPQCQVEEGFRSHVPWEKAVLHFRYIDDIVLISRIYCSRCLRFAVAKMYSVPFDCSSPGERILCWLDMKIFLDSGELGLFFKPLFPSPPWHSNVLYLRNLFLGRFHRWTEIAPVQLEWQRAVISLLLDVQKSGWQFSKVLFVLHSIHSCSYKDFVFFAIHAWKCMKKVPQ